MNRIVITLTLAAVFAAVALGHDVARARPAPSVAVALAPVDGASGVPLNAHMFVVRSSGIGSMDATALVDADGVSVELELVEVGGIHEEYRPTAPLKPNAEYVWRVGALASTFVTGTSDDEVPPTIAKTGLRTETIQAPMRDRMGGLVTVRLERALITAEDAEDDVALAGYWLVRPQGTAVVDDDASFDFVTASQATGGVTLDATQSCDREPGPGRWFGRFDVMAVDLAGNRGPRAALDIPDLCGDVTPEARPTGAIVPPELGGEMAGGCTVARGSSGSASVLGALCVALTLTLTRLRRRTTSPAARE